MWGPHLLGPLGQVEGQGRDEDACVVPRIPLLCTGQTHVQRGGFQFTKGPAEHPDAV